MWSNKKKAGGTEKTQTSQSSVTASGTMVHSSSETSFTRKVTTVHKTESRVTTAIEQRFQSNSPFVSQNSLNSFTEQGSNSSLQKLDKKDSLFSSFNSKPVFTSSVSADAIPFAPNLSYRSPYADRFRSISYPNATGSTANYRPTERINAPSQNNTDWLTQKVSVEVRKSLKFYDDPKLKVPHYTTRSKPRGRVLIINNIKFVDEKFMRKGAELDETNLLELFSQMGFTTVLHRNLNKKNMETKIKSFRDNNSLKKVDIAAVVIMSHGTGKASSDSTQVVCTDEQLLATTWIVNQFDSESCPNLRQKPKIFIFQCCRGNNTDVVQHDSAAVGTVVPRILSDMLIAYSTVPGFVSHRAPEHGTWYIQAICKVFMEDAHDTDVENLLKLVDSKLSSAISNNGSKQTSSFENRGFKTCYLHPGKYQ